MGHRDRGDRQFRGGRFFLSANHCRSSPNERGFNLPGILQRLADTRLGWLSSLSRDQLPRVFTQFNNPACGDFVRIGNGVPSTDLGASGWGDRAGSAVGVIERTKSDTGTIWAGTGTGRIFFTSNGDAAAGSVVWERLDLSSTVDPNRFPSSIYIDPANSNHAWISYSGYNVNTPSQPGHVFEVTRTGPSTATWVNISYNLGDQPITDLVRDDITGDLYAASDFGVMRLPNATTTWVLAGNGFPMVEVPGLTIVPSARILYAATHGRSAWSLKLP